MNEEFQLIKSLDHYKAKHLNKFEKLYTFYVNQTITPLEFLEKFEKLIKEWQAYKAKHDPALLQAFKDEYDTL